MDIIIVDDEPVSLTVLKQLTEKLPNCKVQGFRQPAAALSWCQPNQPDVVIVDYMMPGCNGIEFTQRLCALKGRADTPLLMVTASADRRVRNSALENGINDVLNKPFDSADLHVRVSNMLALRANQKKVASRAFLLTQGFQATTQSRGSSRLLDINVTLSRLAGDETLLGEVARIFVSTVPSVLASISAALSDSDFELAYMEAYALKGAIASLEAPEVLASVVDVETHARDHEPAAAAAAFAKAQVLVERLLTEVAPMAPVGRDNSSQP
jgi:DNA-binding response OmpR family regulator